MNCPKCGCKMKKEIICPYCKITGDEVRFASNVEAKKRIKEKNTEDVLMSSYIPYDVSKKKLALIMIFGGFLGFDAYYLGRKKYGIIKISIIGLAFFSFILSFYLGYSFMETPTDILTFICAIFMIMWFSSLIGLIFNKCKVPIVLPNEQQLKQRIIDKKEEQDKKERLKEEKTKQKFDKKVKNMQKKMQKEEDKKKKDEKE